MNIKERLVSKKTAMYLRQIYSGKESERIIRILCKKRALMIAVITCITVPAAIPVFITESISASHPVTGLERGEYGEGVRTVTLRAVTETGQEERVTVNVNERRYTERELEEFSDKLDEELATLILADNPDTENVMYDLDLKNRITGYPFEISWKSDKPLILGGSGMINHDRLEKEDPDNEGVNVCLRATLKYADYLEDKYFYVILRRTVGTVAENLKNCIEASVIESDQKTQTDKEQELPKYSGGHRLMLYEQRPNKGWAILFAGVMAAVIPIVVKDGKIKDKADERSRQIEKDYPKVLNRYMLYYMAGMNPRAIWTAICDRYESERELSGEGKRYVYEEMISAKKKMDEGLTELAAYDEFATRCNSLKFRTFTGLVRQAVVKGNDGLGRLLYEETEKAGRDNINRVKVEASEASTKLLLPMFMMFLVVLAIVMIPAYAGLKM